MDKIQKARTNLVLSHPFYGSLILRMEVVETDKVPTFATDGIRIYYNKEFAETLSVDEIIGVLAHEGHHVALLHNLRMGPRQHMPWNAACDLAINPYLKQSGFTLPEGSLDEKKYHNMTAEQIYDKLPVRYVNFSGIGDVMRPTGRDGRELTAEEMKEIEFDQKINITQAATKAKMAGKLPAGLERLVQDIVEPKVSWQDFIHRWLSQFVPVDYTWRRPSRRFISSGLYLPGVLKSGIGDIVFGVDTSGSVDNEMLTQFQAEVRSCLNQFGFRKAYIVYCDTQVHIQTVEDSHDIAFQAKGGGGTMFTPVFEWIEKNDIKPDCLVYLSDMECSDYPKEPEYPTLWVGIGGGGTTPPFGELIRIEK